MSGIAWLHRDDQLVAVDKPAGEPVIAARGEAPEACLVRRGEAALDQRLFVVHRIDRDTSGVVLFARSAAVHRFLSQAFEARQVRKGYVAFAAGVLEPDRGRIEVPLHAARRGKARPAGPGEPGQRAAVTEYTVERVWSGAQGTVSRIALHPITGRHHQIRVHLRARGAPILFDPLYGRGIGDAFEAAPCRRLALHALAIDVPLPEGRRLEIRAPLAPDLVGLEAWLDARAPPALALP